VNRAKSKEQPDDRHLAAFHQLNPNPVIGVNSAGSVTFLSDGVKRALVSLGKKAPPEVFLPEDLGDILAALKRREPASFQREVTVGDRIFEEDIQVRPEHDAVFIHARDITELRRAEEKVRKQTALLQALVESPTDIIVFALDRNYCYTAFNTAHRREMKKVYGVDIRTGANMLDLIDIPEVRAKARRSFDRALAGESFTEIEVQPGLGIWYEFNWSPIRTADGRMDGLTALVQDITRRKRVETALAESELKYRRVFESSNDAIVLLDSDRFFDCNPATLKVFGYSTRDEFLGKHPAEVSPPRQTDGRDSRLAADEKIAAAFKAGRNYFEWLHQRADGTVFPADVLLTPMDFRGRKVMQATVRDITARKQAEERDRQHLEDTALLRDTAIGFIQLGRDADIYQYVADRLSQLIGEAYVVINSYDEAADQLTVRAIAGIGARLETVLEVFGRNPVGTVFTLAEEHRPEYASEKLLKFEDGIRGLSYGRLPRTLTQTIEKTFDLGGIYAMGFYWQGRILGTLNVLMRRGMDVRDPGAVEAFVNQAAIAIQHRRDADELDHHREHLEELVRERTAELEEANRELEAFSYSVSHDLRAPLRAIDGFTQAVVEDCGTHLDAKACAHLDRVSAAARRMSELIDDLLNLARIARLPLERKPVNLSELARTIAAELRRTAPDRKVKFVIPDGLTAPADPVLAGMVLRNLLSNAWKFTSRHPTARIEFGKTHANGGRVLFVRDDGAGFDMAYVDKLFAPFQRLHTDHEFPGSGIGLAIVHRIVQRHGGKVWIEAEVEKGATCRFTLESATREA